MRRSTLRRTPFRRHPKVKKPKAVRPGVTPPLPRGWVKLAKKIRKRDGDYCRYCDALAPGGPVDHVIPRRLLVGKEVAISTNLVLLCETHHATKTLVVEPALYRGDVLAFELFSGVLASTGSTRPSVTLTALAYGRLREML